MKPKQGALIIALILVAVVTLLFVVLPSSANLTTAYIFCLIGIALMESGFLLATAKNVPASYALMKKTGKFLPWSLVISAVVLILQGIGLFTLPVLWHVIIQIVLLTITSIGMVKIFAGAAYVEQVAEKAEVKNSGWTELVNQANALTAKEQNMEAKAALKKVADALRYADPMGTSASAAQESQIAEKLNCMQSADAETRRTLCGELLMLIRERNAVVKSSK